MAGGGLALVGALLYRRAKAAGAAGETEGGSECSKGAQEEPRLFSFKGPKGRPPSPFAEGRGPYKRGRDRAGAAGEMEGGSECSKGAREGRCAGGAPPFFLYFFFLRPQGTPFFTCRGGQAPLQAERGQGGGGGPFPCSGGVGSPSNPTPVGQAEGGPTCSTGRRGRAGGGGRGALKKKKKAPPGPHHFPSTAFPVDRRIP